MEVPQWRYAVGRYVQRFCGAVGAERRPQAYPATLGDDRALNGAGAKGYLWDARGVICTPFASSVQGWSRWSLGASTPTGSMTKGHSPEDANRT
jgi:hypothetical protein